MRDGTHGGAVRKLQAMLNRLGQVYPQLPALAEDGDFGERTLEAVMIFQRDFGLPVTGAVNGATWDALHWHFRRTHPCRSGLCLPVLEGAVAPGGRGDAVRVAQSALGRLEGVLAGIEGVERDGRLRGATARALRAVQQGAGLPETGALDEGTWQALSLLFRAAALHPGGPFPA